MLWPNNFIGHSNRRLQTFSSMLGTGFSFSQTCQGHISEVRVRDRPHEAWHGPQASSAVGFQEAQPRTSWACKIMQMLSHAVHPLCKAEPLTEPAMSIQDS